jgi:E3 ubiquitin-protein ligase TRIP12
MVDQGLHNSLLAIKEGEAENMNLDYVLPGFPEYELIKNGENIPITTENVDMYIKDVLDATLGKGVSLQIGQFRKGFSKIIDPQIFQAFSPSEIDTLISGQSDSEWTFQGIF